MCARVSQCVSVRVCLCVCVCCSLYPQTDIPTSQQVHKPNAVHPLEHSEMSVSRSESVEDVGAAPVAHVASVFPKSVRVLPPPEVRVKPSSGLCGCVCRAPRAWKVWSRFCCDITVPCYCTPDNCPNYRRFHKMHSRFESIVLVGSVCVRGGICLSRELWEWADCVIHSCLRGNIYVAM